jgi:hypothetical protein
MRKLLLKIDNFLCRYFGLDICEITPHFAGIKNRNIVVLHTESYKRHIQASPVFEIRFNSMTKENKEKLGIAMGKLIATNLVVSFEDIYIKRENTHAT